MTRYSCLVTGLSIAALCCTAPARAEAPRDLLTQAGFVDRDRAVALARVERAATTADAILARSPGDEEAAMMQAMALGYRAKLTGSRSQAIAARDQFQALVARYPKNAEAQAALGAWHVGVIVKLGKFVARAVAGAQKSVALSALDRSVAMGGNRAMLAGFAGLLRLELDPQDPIGKTLVERAARAPAPTPVDVFVRRAAGAVLTQVNAGNDAAVKSLSSRLLPFGQFG